MKFFLYKIVNTINNKVYVGVTSNLKQRWNTHKNIAIGGKDKFPKHYQAIHAAINKYGVDNFILEIIQELENEDQCYFEEMNFISNLKKENIPHYNIAGGGKGTGSGINHPTFGKKLPESWVKAISIASKEAASRPEVKEKHRNNMVDRNWVGENHPMFGKQHSIETKQIISEKGKGRVFTDIHKQNISKSLSSKEKSIEHKNNLSLSKKGKHVGTNNPNAKLTEEDILEIKRLLETKLSSRKIAALFNVSHPTVLRYKNQK